jgi:D-alanyl-lipoteichoic acid acyltransferase DltB (MBOAT superfamily)
VFYGFWDWRFLMLILFSTIVDFLVGKGLQKVAQKNKRKLLLCTSIVVNLGFLGFFKYYNFFLDNFVDAFSILGYKINANSLNIILPVGISFYTFQTLSYTIDVYRKNLTACRDFIAFSAFVSFFPQLVAGPIERATRLLPQFYSKREFNYAKAVDGMRQILWGLFKKIVIADNCAEYANLIFEQYDTASGSTLVLGALFFTFQIYGDFSGYSDIAIGTARLFGFDLMRNFAYPYFSRDVAEFWRRWHISLSTWFRDYLYIPLGGSRGSTWIKIRNVFIIFIVSGFWHGANWTFIVWGALNAIYILPLMLFNINRNNLETVAQGRLFPSIKEVSAIVLTFSLTVLAWIFFRAENLNHAFVYIKNIFSKSLLSMPEIEGKAKAYTTLLLIVFLLFIEWISRDQQHALGRMKILKRRPVRWTSYIGIVLLIYFLGNFSESIEFIYFQF